MTDLNEITKKRQNEQHRRALMMPEGFEKPLVMISRALRIYGDLYIEKYTEQLGDQARLGFMEICHGLITLLNGNTGRLSAGAIDSDIRTTAAGQGINLDLLKGEN